MEGDLKILNEKLSSAISECNTKDELLRKHEKMAQEAIAGHSPLFINALFDLIFQGFSIVFVKFYLK